MTYKYAHEFEKKNFCSSGRQSTEKRDAQERRPNGKGISERELNGKSERDGEAAEQGREKNK